MATKLELLREFCKQNEIQMEILPMGIRLQLPEEKDPWEGVEFFSFNGTHRKIINSTDKLIYTQKGDSFWRDECKPSTKEAYEEQLKKEAFERFGDIKNGDLFDFTSLDYPKHRAEIYLSENPVWMYNSKEDELTINGFPLYKQGKWAERVNGRVLVYYSHQKGAFGINLAYSLNKRFTQDEVIKMKSFVRKQLEAYLNNETEPKKIEDRGCAQPDPRVQIIEYIKRAMIQHATRSFKQGLNNKLICPFVHFPLILENGSSCLFIFNEGEFEKITYGSIEILPEEIQEYL